MKEKQFEPGKGVVTSPAPGIASVNTHDPDRAAEETLDQKDRDSVRELKKEVADEEGNKSPERPE